MTHRIAIPAAVVAALFVTKQLAATQGTPDTSVEWAQAVGVSAVTSKIAKIGLAHAWDAGAVSTDGLGEGDGYAEITAGQTHTYRAFGLSHGDTDQGYSGIDFAFSLAPGGTYSIVERGQLQGVSGTFTTTDRLRVGVESGIITYRKNDAIVYRSTVAPTYPLLVDTALASRDAVIEGVVLSGMRQPVAAAAPVLSVRSGDYPGPFTVGVTVPALDAIIHFTTNGADPTEADPVIPFGELAVNRSMVLKTRAYTGGLMPSRVVGARYSVGLSPTVEEVVWTSAWNSRASSTKGIVSVDGHMELTARQLGPYQVVGLSHVDGAIAHGEVDFGFYLYSNRYSIVEKGTDRKIGGRLALGDRLRVGVESGIITYRRNGEVVYQSLRAPVYPLFVDVSMYTIGARIDDVMLAGALQPLAMKAPALGIPSGDDRGPRANPTASDPVVGGAVAAGGAHSLALWSDGLLWSWGDNGHGQLGDGTREPHGEPAVVSGVSDVIAVATGGRHSLALKRDGSVVAWGGNDAGQVGDGSREDRTRPTPVSGLAGIVAIAAGEDFSLALRRDGMVVAWGSNVHGQLGSEIEGSATSPVAVAGISDVVKVAAGVAHALAVTRDGRAWGWGSNAFFQLGSESVSSSRVPLEVAGLDLVAEIAAGDGHSLAVGTNGTPWAWGRDGAGRLGDGDFSNDARSTPIQVRARNGDDCSGGGGQVLTGPVIANEKPCGVPLVGLQAMVAGNAHSVGLTRDGRVLAWGSNSHGQLGTGSDVETNTAVPTRNLADIVQISAAGDHALALASNGTIWSWGRNDSGQVGDGTDQDRAEPVALGSLSTGWKTATPVLSLAPGRYFDEQAATIHCSTPGATIRYTLDGREPSETDPAVASGGVVVVDRSVTLTARAWSAGRLPSTASAASYVLQVAEAVLTPPPGAYDAPLEVTAAATTPGATIRYRFEDWPTDQDPILAPGAPVLVAPPAALHLEVSRPGWEPARTRAEYQLGVVMPVITPPGGHFTAPVTVKVSTSTPGATLRYSTDGEDPSADRYPILASGGTLRVDRSMTLKVVAWRDDGLASDVASADFVFGLAAPTLIDERPRGADSPFYLRGASSASGATVRCTMDGGEPTAFSLVCTAPVPVDRTTTVKAKAFLAGWDPSPTVERTFEVSESAVSTPRLSLASGLYASRRRVVVSCATAGAVIRYTTDGTDPDATDPILVSGDTILIDRSLTLKARAWANGGESLVARADYLLSGAVAVASDDFRRSRSVLALKTDGSVVGWGDNRYWQLGVPIEAENVDQPIASQIDSVLSLAAGAHHVVALRENGTVWTWGANADGQLGIGDWSQSRGAPAPVGLSGMTAVAAGGSLSAAISTGGALWVWGGGIPAPLLVGDAGCARIHATESEILCSEVGGGTRAYTWPSGSLGYNGLSGGLGVSGATSGAIVLVTDGGAKGVVARLKKDNWFWSVSDRRVDLPLASVIASNVLVSRRGLPWARGVSWFWEGIDFDSILPFPVTEAAPALGAAFSTLIGSDGTVWQLDPAWSLLPVPQAVAGLRLFDDGWPLADPDSDGLTNAEELDLGTDLLRADTNGDGVVDGVSAETGRDPVSVDLDGDGLSNETEREAGTDPLRTDTDGDGVNDAGDAFPLDPSRSEPPRPAPGDTTPPDIFLLEPRNAVPWPPES